MLHLLAGLKVVVAHWRSWLVADAVPAAKRGERGIGDRHTSRDQFFVHADQIAAALLVQLDDLIAMGLRFLGAFKAWHHRAAGVQHCPDRAP
jgi:hypothetical protein